MCLLRADWVLWQRGKDAGRVRPRDAIKAESATETGGTKGGKGRSLGAEKVYGES